MVIKVILWALLGLLGLLLVLLVVPASLSVRFEEGSFYLSVRWLFLRFKLFPKKEKKTSKKKQPLPDDKKEAEKDSAEKQKKKKSFPEILHFIRKIASSASDGMGFLFKFLLIRQIELVVPVHAEEAGETAIRCGQIQALIGATRAALENVFNLSFKMLQVYPDFLGRYTAGIYFSCKVVASPVIIIATAFVAFKRYLTYDHSLRQLVFKPFPHGRAPAKGGQNKKRKKE